MSAKANYFKLGLFVIAGVTLLCGGVIILGGGKLFERTYTVETYMTESVEGINKGSAVKYRGIDLGQVSGVSMAARKYDRDQFVAGRLGGTVLVEMAIRSSALDHPSEEVIRRWLEQKAVPAGLRTRTASSGLTGPAFIELLYLDPVEFPPPRISWTPPALYIPSAPSTMQVLLRSVQGILKQVEKVDLQAVVADAEKLLQGANAKLDELDVRTLNADAKKFLDELRSKIDGLDTGKISEKAVALLDEVRKSNDRLQQILSNPKIDPAIDDLRATLESAKKAAERIEAFVSDPRVSQLMTDLDKAGSELSPAMQDFRRAVRRIDLLIQTQQSTIEASLADLNAAIRNIKGITDDASRNPARTLFGEPPPPVTPGVKK